MNLTSRFHNPTLLAVLACVVCSTFSSSIAQEDTEAAEKPDVEMLECNVKVIDPDGHPVEDATVFCSGMRTKEEPGSHWSWMEETFGKIPRIKTNADGIAVMPYPKVLGEDKTTGQMTWTVEHPDFVNYRQDHSVDDDPAELQLERGFRIALTAKRASSGEKIKENLHAVTSFKGGGKWELKKNGTFVSGVMKKQDGIMRIAHFQDGKPTLFSDEIKVEPGDKSRLLLKDVELSVGCRVEGKLHDSVSRPVNNGYVIASLVKRPDPKVWSSLWWTAEAKISEDGTFVFESLPRDEAIQMIPICDGFVPAKPKPEDVLAVLPTDSPDQIKRMIDAFTATPQLVKSAGNDVAVTLLMTKAATVTVKVVDQDGKPVKNVRVATNPNQYWFLGGSQILGSSYPTRLIWEKQQKGEDINAFYQSIVHPYMKATDENGVACLQDMPKGRHTIGVYEKEWKMPKDLMSGEREKRVQVGDKDKSITIKVYPKGSLPKGGRPLSETLTDWWNQMTEKDE